MAAFPWDLLENRRRTALASSILWGSAHYSPKAGLVLSSDGHAYTVGNLYYAASLLEATVDGLDVQIPSDEAKARANGILTRLFAQISAGSEAPLPRYVGSNVPAIPTAIASRLVLALLAYLEVHRSQLGVSEDVASRIGPIVAKLLQESRPLRRPLVTYGARPPAPTSTREPAPLTAESLLQRLHQILGKDIHWSSSTGLIPYRPGGGGDHPWPIPPPPCSTPLAACTTTTCTIPCFPFDPSLINHCPTWADACSTPHVDMEFFKGRRTASFGPVIFVGGWEPQLHDPTPGGFGFGDEESYSTLEPSHTPAGVGTHCGLTAYPPLDQVEVSGPDKRTFYGLATMLRCGAGYDHVRWSQTHPSGPIQDAVNELAAVVQKTKELYQVNKVVLVCHSRGGLIARKYILNRWLLCGDVDVEKIITYGTPHLGAELAYLAADTIVEIFTTDLFWVLIDLIVGTTHSPLLDVLDVVGLISPQVKHDLEAKFIEMVWPIVQLVSADYLNNYVGFITSGDEMRPDSPFITQLNQGYAAAQVTIKGKNTPVSLWEAIPHVLVAGTSPDYWAMYVGDWLSGLTVSGISQALLPTGTCMQEIAPGVYVPAPKYQWNWGWFRILRVLGDITPFINALASLSTFREGEGDSIVARSSALAIGITGAITRVEFALNHFNLKANTEQQTAFDVYGVNPWQLLFLELYIDNISSPSTDCRNLAECQGFSFQQAL